VLVPIQRHKNEWWVQSGAEQRLHPTCSEHMRLYSTHMCMHVTLMLVSFHRFIPLLKPNCPEDAAIRIVIG
jgi:hypothetical protein